jgi:pectin methylesterase-like acyl-CoA thioesterase
MRISVTNSVTLLLVLVLLTASCLIVPLPVKAGSRTIVVPDDYPTIQAAVDNASAGDTVFVKEGTYNYSIFGYDGIYIGKPISLIGQDSQKDADDKPYKQRTRN